jgi:hypothetical protein
MKLIDRIQDGVTLPSFLWLRPRTIACPGCGHMIVRGRKNADLPCGICDSFRRQGLLK